MEMFQGILILYYSVEICHSLRGKDFNNMQYIVDEMEAPWESRPYSEHTKMHRTAAERMFNNRRQQWTDLEMHSLEREQVGAKPGVRVGVSLLGQKGVAKGVTGSGQDVPAATLLANSQGIARDIVPN